MFDNIAERYDVMNRLMSLGLDRGWRRRCVERLSSQKLASILDVATGTADLAIAAARRYPDARVVGLDPSEQMLEVARTKLAKLGLLNRIELVRGEAESLPFSDGSFDAAMIAFGIRNVPDRPRALLEFHRVVRPGGLVCALELNEPTSGWLGPVTRLWVHQVIPTLGRLFTRGGEYGYLRESMERFPSPKEFERLLDSSGLEPLATDRLGLGACHLFVTRRSTP
jgi:demethylmenaquinone methyltransferase / 2-methoxy-6-polyprenyl-1,4-benzoquinol methylase